MKQDVIISGCDFAGQSQSEGSKCYQCIQGLHPALLLKLTDSLYKNRSDTVVVALQTDQTKI